MRARLTSPKKKNKVLLNAERGETLPPLQLFCDVLSGMSAKPRTCLERRVIARRYEPAERFPLAYYMVSCRCRSPCFSPVNVVEYVLQSTVRVICFQFQQWRDVIRGRVCYVSVGLTPVEVYDEACRGFVKGHLTVVLISVYTATAVLFACVVPRFPSLCRRNVNYTYHTVEHEEHPGMS